MNIFDQMLSRHEIKTIGDSVNGHQLRRKKI
jgi:hypothetical protein